MADNAQRQLGNYRLVRLIGQGGFADVYLAEHLYLATQAAIKVLQLRLIKNELNEFLTEARTIGGLNHPHIIRILDFGVDNTQPFLVMDYAPNGTLRDLHPKGTRVDLERVVGYVREIAQALEYAHARHIIHRDVKPENMLVGDHQQVLLSDFGIALATQSSRYQKTDEVVGTVAYMAPEQLQGKPRSASDQYALGIVIYEWLSGERPFHGTFPEMFSQHMFVSPPSLCEKVPGLPPAVEQVVMTALAKDPQERFASITAFANALEQASLENSDAQAFVPTVVKRPASPVDPVLAVPPVQRSSSPTGKDDPEPTAAAGAPHTVQAIPGKPRDSSTMLPAQTSSSGKKSVGVMPSHEPTSPPQASRRKRRRWMSALLIVPVLVIVVAAQYLFRIYGGLPVSGTPSASM